MRIPGLLVAQIAQEQVVHTTQRLEPQDRDGHSCHARGPRAVRAVVAAGGVRTDEAYARGGAIAGAVVAV